MGCGLTLLTKNDSAIVDAIANQDGEMAELLMRQHIRLSRMNIERQINWKGGDESRQAI
jgi:DNA-binding GntR family transcriptional regulator